MAAPNYQASDFLRVLQALMPRGLAWPRDPTAVQEQVMAGLAPTWERHTEQNNNLLIDAFPATAVQLLPEWESALGLPDPCAGESPTLKGRQAQVVARFSSSGGQSIPYFIQYAETLGFTITVTEYIQARAGILRAGDPCNGYDWNFAWKVIAPPNTIVRAVAGAMAAGDPLAAFGNEVLECEIRALIPAHTIVLFAYGKTGLLDSTFILDESVLY